MYVAVRVAMAWPGQAIGSLAVVPRIAGGDGGLQACDA